MAGRDRQFVGRGRDGVWARSCLSLKVDRAASRAHPQDRPLPDRLQPPHRHRRRRGALRRAGAGAPGRHLLRQRRRAPGLSAFRRGDHPGGVGGGQTHAREDPGDPSRLKAAFEERARRGDVSRRPPGPAHRRGPDRSALGRIRPVRWRASTKRRWFRCTWTAPGRRCSICSIRVSPELRDVTLFHELLNKRGKAFSLIVGPVIPPERLDTDAAAVATTVKALRGARAALATRTRPSRDARRPSRPEPGQPRGHRPAGGRDRARAEGRRRGAPCRDGLGAGKSTLARGLVRALTTPDEEAPSPTFTLVQTYDCTPQVAWFDLYRLTRPEEVYELGHRRGAGRGRGRGRMAAAPWRSRLPPDRLDIELAGYGTSGRTARIVPHGTWKGRELGGGA